MNLVDVLLAVIAVLIVFSGYKKGLIVSLLEMAKLAVGMPLSYWVSDKYNQVFYDSFVHSIVQDKINKEVSTYANTDQFIDSIKQSVGSFPEFMRSAIDLKALDKVSTDNIALFVEKNVVEPIALIVVKVALFLACLIIFGLIVSFLLSFFRKQNRGKGSVLKTTNRIAGGVFGGVRAVLFIAVIATVCFYVANLYTGENNDMINMLKESVILNNINNINPMI